jgi:hypothetical protein
MSWKGELGVEGVAGMTLDEIRKERHALELEVGKLVNEFKKKTGLKIRKISVGWVFTAKNDSVDVDMAFTNITLEEV